MIVIGATFADALAFLGIDIGPTEDDARGFIAAGGFDKAARREERASASVPDVLWPAGEFFTTWFRGGDFTNENGSAPYDAVIITRGAGACEALAWDVIDALIKPGGWCYVEQHRGRGPFWRRAAWA